MKAKKIIFRLNACLDWLETPRYISCEAPAQRPLTGLQLVVCCSVICPTIALTGFTVALGGATLIGRLF